MHVRSTTLPGEPASPDVRSKRLANRVAVRATRSPASTYRAPSVVRLKPGPLHKLAWIFGLR